MAEVCASGLQQMETSVGCDVRLNNVSENEKGVESSDVVWFRDSEEKTAGRDGNAELLFGNDQDG